MKLVVTSPGQSVEINGTLKTLMAYVRKDLAGRGLSDSEVQRHIYSLSLEMHRVRAANVIDGEGNLIAGYRITR